MCPRQSLHLGRDGGCSTWAKPKTAPPPQDRAQRVNCRSRRGHTTASVLESRVLSCRCTQESVGVVCLGGNPPGNFPQCYNQHMRIAYQYRLKPITSQSAQMENWRSRHLRPGGCLQVDWRLEMLCSQYNYRLAQRFDWYDETRCRLDACPLICSILPVEEIFKDIPVNRIGNQGYVDWKALQKGDLPQTKVERPWYKDIYSQVLQDCVLRVDKTFERFIFGDKKGKHSGRPRFKSRSRYRSFTFPQIKQDCIESNRITLPKIGDVRIVLHRPLPDGFKIKTATVMHKADGWYVTLSLQDDTVPVRLFWVSGELCIMEYP